MNFKVVYVKFSLTCLRDVYVYFKTGFMIYGNKIHSLVNIFIVLLTNKTFLYIILSLILCYRSITL